MPETVWSFKTRNFTVRLNLEPEYEPIDVDDDGETAEAVERGDYLYFCAVVEVRYHGCTIGENVLGCCIYESAEDFYASHRDRDPMNRNCSVMRAARGNVVICHYFPDMVRQAIAEARKTLLGTPYIRATAA